MQRFYQNKSLSETEILTDSLFHQLTRVLRIREGEKIILFNGDGMESVYEIVSLRKKECTAIRRALHTPEDREVDKNITLYQALPNKMEKIEWILQKNTEIGVKKMVFFRSERSQKLMLSENKIKRFHSIVVEAAEQCGALVLPRVIFLEWWLDEALQQRKDGEMGIMLHTQWRDGAWTEWKNEQNIGIWVWPEWGWSDMEIKKMENYYMITAHFWERILRTETAGMVMAFSLIHA